MPHGTVRSRRSPPKERHRVCGVADASLQLFSNLAKPFALSSCEGNQLIRRYNGELGG